MPTRFPQHPPSPEKFQTARLKTKSSFRDYFIYATLLLMLTGLIGCSIYYLTRPPQKQAQLRTSFDRTLFNMGLGPDPDKEETSGSKGSDQLTENTNALPATAARRPALNSSSAYAGGGPNSVLPSTDPKSPPASAAFRQVVQSLKISSIVPGNPAKMMLNGRLFRTGELIEDTLAVTFVAVDSEKKLVLFRDKSGAELRLTY